MSVWILKVEARNSIGLFRNAAPKSFWSPCIQVTDILKRKLCKNAIKISWKSSWMRLHFMPSRMLISNTFQHIFKNIYFLMFFFYYFQYIFCHSQFLIKFSSKSQNVFATENENQSKFTFKRNKSSPLMHLFQIFISNVNASTLLSPLFLNV